MLHPIMPHITEKVWQGLKQFGLGENAPEALIVAEYPTYKDSFNFPKEAEEMKLVFDTITSLRNVRQSFNIPTSLTINVEIRAEGREKEIFEAIESYIKRLAKVNDIKYASVESEIPPKSATAVVSSSKIIIPLADLIDLSAEIKRQEKKLEKLTNEKNSLLGRMKNEKFVANAPKELVEQTNARIEEISVQEKIINDLIVSLR
jgi:valyl-tRNA synthetase